MPDWPKRMRLALDDRPPLPHALFAVIIENACRTASWSSPSSPPRFCFRPSGNGAHRPPVSGRLWPATIPLSSLGDLNPPLVFRHALQSNFKVPLPNEARKFLAPLNQQDALRPHQIIQPQRFQFPIRVHSVEVNVIKRGARPAILVYEGKSWAGDVVCGSGPEPFGNPFHEGSFAGAGIA